jgi:hypothetical protein
MYRKRLAPRRGVQLGPEELLKIDGVLEKHLNIDSLPVQIADYFPTSEKVMACSHVN